MRQWFKTMALGAVLTMVIAVPAAAQDGDFDDAPMGSTERVAEQVMEQGQLRLSASDVVTPAPAGDQVGEQSQVRDRDRLRDGTGGDCDGTCDGDGAMEQARVRDRLHDGTGGSCVGDCDGDRAMEMEQIRQRIRDARDGCEAGWMFTHCHAWAHQVAL